MICVYAEKIVEKRKNKRGKKYKCRERESMVHPHV